MPPPTNYSMKKPTSNLFWGIFFGPQMLKTVWPSGLRRQTQVLVERSAWVRTPQLSFCYQPFNHKFHALYLQKPIENVTKILRGRQSYCQSLLEALAMGYFFWHSTSKLILQPMPQSSISSIWFTHALLAEFCSRQNGPRHKQAGKRKPLDDACHRIES